MNPIEALDFFFTKQGSLDDDWSPYIVNRFLSMDPYYAKVAFGANNYVYFGHKEILKGWLLLFLPKLSRAPFIRYIKSKKEEVSEYQELFGKMKQYYQWSDRDLEDYSDYYLKLFRDKDKLDVVCRFFGVDLNAPKEVIKKIKGGKKRFTKPKKVL